MSRYVILRHMERKRSVTFFQKCTCIYIKAQASNLVSIGLRCCDLWLVSYSGLTFYDLWLALSFCGTEYDHFNFNIHWL